MKDFEGWPVKTKTINLYDVIAEINRKRINSSFIYPVAQLEEIFGYLWGEQKDENEPLTPEEQVMFDKFILWRKKVLDYGNQQIRIARNEIYKYIGGNNGKNNQV